MQKLLQMGRDLLDSGIRIVKKATVKAEAWAIGGVTALTGLLGFSTPHEALAALPPEVTAAKTEMEGNINAMFGEFFPLVVLFVSLAMIITLFKRFSRKV